MDAPQPIPEIDEEQWRPIPGREGRYSVSSWGRVRSEPRVVPHGLTGTYTVKGRILKTTPPKGGYHQFSDGHQNGLLVHRAVAAAFIGPRPPGHETRHLDDDRDNNRVDNLCYGTVSDNQADAKRNGKRCDEDRGRRGSDHGQAKLTEKIVRDIRTSTESGVALARRYEVSTSAICAIRTRRSWRHV